MQRRLGDALAVYVDAMRYPSGTEDQRASMWLDHTRRHGWKAVAAVEVPDQHDITDLAGAALPAAPMPRTAPQPHPAVTRRGCLRSASWPGRASRARCADRRMKGHSTGAGTPRIVRADPSSVKGAPTARLLLRKSKPLTLEPLSAQRPVNTGQAEGPAR